MLLPCRFAAGLSAVSTGAAAAAPAAGKAAAAAKPAAKAAKADSESDDDMFASSDDVRVHCVCGACGRALPPPFPRHVRHSFL